jgi:hypothetical protein
MGGLQQQQHSPIYIIIILLYSFSGRLMELCLVHILAAPRLRYARGCEIIKNRYARCKCDKVVGCIYIVGCSSIRILIACEIEFLRPNFITSWCDRSCVSAGDV